MPEAATKKRHRKSLTTRILPQPDCNCLWCEGARSQARKRTMGCECNDCLDTEAFIARMPRHWLNVCADCKKAWWDTASETRCLHCGIKELERMIAQPLEMLATGWKPLVKRKVQPEASRWSQCPYCRKPSVRPIASEDHGRVCARCERARLPTWQLADKAQRSKTDAKSNQNTQEDSWYDCDFWMEDLE